MFLGLYFISYFFPKLPMFFAAMNLDWPTILQVIMLWVFCVISGKFLTGDWAFFAT